MKSNYHSLSVTQKIESDLSALTQTTHLSSADIALLHCFLAGLFRINGLVPCCSVEFVSERLPSKLTIFVETLFHGIGLAFGPSLVLAPYKLR